jgi:hypothetical protein
MWRRTVWWTDTVSEEPALSILREEEGVGECTSSYFTMYIASSVQHSFYYVDYNLTIITQLYQRHVKDRQSHLNIPHTHTHKVPYKIRDECKNSNIDYTERYYTKIRTSERYASHTLKKLTERIIMSSRDPLGKLKTHFRSVLKSFNIDYTEN